MENDRNREFAVDGVHISRLQKAQANEVVVGKLWALVVDDALARYEMTPHINALSHRLACDSTIKAQLADLGENCSLLQIASIIGDLVYIAKDVEEKCKIKYLEAVILFLDFRFGRALKILQPMISGQCSLEVLTLAGSAALNIGMTADAEIAFGKALSLMECDNASDRLLKVILMANLAACREERLECLEAIKIYTRALNELDLVIPHQNLAKLVEAALRNNIGYSLTTLSADSLHSSNLIEAERQLKRALELREEAYDNDANVATTMLNLAEVCRKKGYNAGRRDWIDRANGRLKRFGRPHILFASISNTIGQICFEEKDFAKAMMYFGEARVILEQNFGQSGIKYAITTYSIGQAEKALGKPSAYMTIKHAREIAVNTIDNESHPFVIMIDDELRRISKAR